jgi:hypothetical protein
MPNLPAARLLAKARRPRIRLAKHPAVKRAAAEAALAAKDEKKARP